VASVVILSNQIGIPLAFGLYTESPISSTSNDEPSTTTSNSLSKIIDLAGYQVDIAVLKHNQTLSSVLKPYGLTVTEISTIAKIAKGIFDVRLMKVGRPYWVVQDTQPPFKVKYFIYDKTSENLIAFKFDESPEVFVAKKALNKLISGISGKITSSLWASIKAKGASDELIFKLEEVLGNKVNFHRLKHQDRFAVIYEKYMNNGRVEMIGDILAAKLTSDGNPVEAFQYRHCGTVGYFDRDGNNIQSSFLNNPLPFGTVTSGYSTRRKHPVTEKYRKHLAIDFDASAGTPVMSVGDGTIISLSYSKSAGNFIKINHSANYTSQYLHLSDFVEGIKVGMEVRKGEVIGFVGDTGLTTGPHLDFRFTENGKRVDYRKIDLPDGQPVDVNCLNSYKIFIQQFDLDQEKMS
jgi:murein DD-endopeptidase MepM/ murein hydrolase activator NlpD